MWLPPEDRTHFRAQIISLLRRMDETRNKLGGLGGWVVAGVGIGGIRGWRSAEWMILGEETTRFEHFYYYFYYLRAQKLKTSPGSADAPTELKCPDPWYIMHQPLRRPWPEGDINFTYITDVIQPNELRLHHVGRKHTQKSGCAQGEDKHRFCALAPLASALTSWNRSWELNPACLHALAGDLSRGGGGVGEGVHYLVTILYLQIKCSQHCGWCCFPPLLYHLPTSWAR